MESVKRDRESGIVCGRALRDEMRVGFVIVIDIVICIYLNDILLLLFAQSRVKL